MIRSDYFDGSWDTFGYDKNGMLTEAANEQMCLKFEWNQAGDVTGWEVERLLKGGRLGEADIYREKEKVDNPFGCPG